MLRSPACIGLVCCCWAIACAPAPGNPASDSTPGDPSGGGAANRATHSGADAPRGGSNAENAPFADIESPPPAGDAAPDAAVVVRREGCGELVAIVRDFSSSHADFERTGLGLAPDCWLGQGEKGLVKPQLENGYPAYQHPGASPCDSVSGPAQFFEWYVDTPSINERFVIPIAFTEQSPDHFVYDNSAFFPIDGLGFGNEGRAHNYHFTTEVRTQFTYLGGEELTFRGDDDLWLFVNHHLAIDLGGTHGPLAETLVMDSIAERIGLTLGGTYPMDIFHAERHTVDSNFRIETTIQCFETVEPPPPPPPPTIQ